MNYVKKTPWRTGLLGTSVVILVSILSPARGQSLAAQLEAAVVAGDQKKLESLLKQGADSNTRTADGTPIFLLAAYHGKEAIVTALRASAVNVHATNNEGFNALHCAAFGGHPGITRSLLDLGLDVNERIRVDGLTALAIASVCDRLEVARLLLERQANVDLPDTGGHTPLLHAAMRGRTEAIRLLLKNGAKVDTASKHGWTPLMVAAWEGHADIVKLLLEHKANADARNRDHRSARMLAESEGHSAIVKLLAAK